VRGKDDRVEARPCMNLHGMYRCFDVVPQGLFLLFPFPFLVIFGGSSWIFRGEGLEAFL
jgi:hypothetical protein